MAEMNQERFAAIVEAYGAEARRWPEAERDAALAFVRNAREIAEPILAEARALDAVLDFDSAPAHMNDLLAARIAANFKREQRTAMDWKPLAALAACAVFGVIVGFGAGHSAPSVSPSTIAQMDDDYAAEAAVDAAFGMIDFDAEAAGEGG